MTETYKHINNFEDYMISNLGNVKSIKNNSELILQQELIRRNHTNYRRVSLSKDGKITRFQVHRLVAIHFIPNIYNKPLVNHIDNNGENNTTSNLEWVTQSENMIHSKEQGRLESTQSLRCKAASKAVDLKLKAEESMLEGVMFGSWMATGKSIRDGARKMECICTLCGETHLVSKSSLLNGKTNRCLSCGKSHNTVDRRTEEASQYIGQLFNNWKVVDFEIVRSFSGKPRVTTFLKCDCLNCISSVVMRLEQVKKNVINQCIICNHRLKG